jgi:hypothetical protein
LALLEFLPECSAFKTASERDGDGYTHDQRVAAETYNELAKLRSSYHAVHGGPDGVYEPHQFVDPRVERLRAELEEAEDEEREEDDEDFYADMGWS